ncbi:uncharacterized protein LOC141702330 [Apium graveolens]|uniref:uncharacterized protein LOC141702330 n=1 Tax=Apium graveolens TaxID=4045 RepID=UPI003D7B1213
MSRKPFPIGQAWRASKKLELVHTDVCGPMRTPPLDNSKYFILFIDDYSPMTWNQLPTKAVYNRTPLQLWSGRRPTVSHLKIFECVCYIYVPIEKQHKLEDKVDKEILLGYSSQSKGYWVYNPQNNKLQVSRDVVFDENASWDWEQNDINIIYVITETFNPEPIPTMVGQHEEHFREESDSSSNNSDSPKYEYDSFSDSPPTKTRRLSDLYENILRIPNLDPEQVQFCYFTSDVPNNYEQAAHHKEWRTAMKEKISMIEKNQAWVLYDKPPHKDTIGVKWV